MAAPTPTIAVDGDVESADAELEAIALTLHDAVVDHERGASTDMSHDEDGGEHVSRTASTRSAGSLDFAISGGVAGTLPVSMRKVLRETQKDASIQATFGEKLNGAFKMVHLGSCEMPSQAMASCESEKQLEKLVSSHLHKVMLSDTLARKVILLSSCSHVGVVDRAYTSEVIFKYPTSSVVFHGIKTIRRGREHASFIVLIAKSPYLDTDVFHAFEGKSNWTGNKLPFVRDTLTEAIRSAYEGHCEAGADSEMTGNGERVDIPSDAQIYRAKYIGSQKLAAPIDSWYKAAVMTALLADDRNMKKQTSEKTLQHVVDYSTDVVLVNHKEALRVVGADNLEQLSTVIVPSWVQDCKVLDLSDVFDDEASLATLRDNHRRSRSPKPKRKVRASSKALTQRLSNLTKLSSEQRDLLGEQVAGGEMTLDEAVEEATRLNADSSDSVVLIAWRDEKLDCLRVEILVVKSSRTKALKMADEVNKIVKAAKMREDDPFQPLTKMRKPRSEILGAAEVPRDDIVAVQMIGSGQFGEVYLANQHVTDKLAVSDEDENIQRAVKTLRKGAKKRDRSEFCAEAELQLQLNHSNIVKVTGVCMRQEPYLCVLEFEPYGDLKKVLNTCAEKSIDVATPEMLWILQQISSAMEYIHAHRFVHMDLATRNALVGVNSRVKVADFGLSRPYDEGQNGYRLAGKMKLPMLWTPPECMPPLVTRGVNEPAVGDEIPFYSEKTDMWMFGVVIWEVATYGGQPYGNGKLVETLKDVHRGLRLQCPDGTPAQLVTMMDRAFRLVDERPNFKECTFELAEELKNAGGRECVRDIGVLLHEGYTKKLSRSSSIVASSLRARKSGLSTHYVASETNKILREMSDENEHSVVPLSVVSEEGEPAEEDTSATAAAAAAAPAETKPTAKARWKTAQRKLQGVIPLITLHSFKNMALDEETGRLKRIVDPNLLEPAVVDEYEFSTNPFDSDDSDLDVDAELDTIDEDAEVPPMAARIAPKAPVPPAPRPESAEPSSNEMPQVTDDDGDGDDDVGPPENDDEDTDVDDVELEDDMAILQLMAERKEKNRIEEERHQKEIREKYLKEKAESDRLLAIELEEFKKAKAAEAAAKQKEKDAIYEEAQERLAKELRFSFSFAS